MHLSLRVPNIWFRAQIVYPNPRRAGEEVTLTGVTLPGMPALVAGSNGHVAWTFTNSYGDFTDWVRVNHRSGRQDEIPRRRWLCSRCASRTKV